MSQSLLEAGMTNAIIACVMAFAVYGITRVWRNHYLAHSLWLLVLAKLITPTLWHVPVSVPSFRGSNDAEVTASLSDGDIEPLESLSLPMGILAEVSDEVDNFYPPQAVATVSSNRAFSWPLTLLVSWSISSVVWMSIVLWRVFRFSRGLRTTVAAPAELVHSTSIIAKQMGLKRTPPVWLTDAAIGPMVWPLAWRPVVVLPRGLINELDGEQRATVVGHELAHIRRRDHWVRFLELVVSSVFWWNPCLWWVRCKLHAAEEACCDSDVLRLFPQNTIAYGNALLRTSEYMSSARAPALSSGFGGSFSLRRRVEVILNNECVAPMTRTSRFALVAIAVAVMPLTAKLILAQEEPLAANQVSPSEPRTTELVFEDNSSDKAQPKAKARPTVVVADTPASEPKRRSLEERVGRIEELLEELIHAQRAPSQATAKQVFGFSDRLVGQPKGPLGLDTQLVPRSDADPENSANRGRAEARNRTGATEYLPVATPEGTVVYELRTVDKDKGSGTSYLRTRKPRAVNVDDLVKAIKEKRAAITRLEKEIQQIKDALEMDSPYRPPVPARR